MEYRSDSVGIDHLLLGLLSQGRGLLREVFDITGYSIDEFHQVVADSIPRGKNKTDKVKFSQAFKAILQMAHESAKSLSQSYIGTEHLLMAIIKYNDPELENIFNDAGVNPNSLSVAVKAHLLESSEIFTSLEAEKDSSESSSQLLSPPAQTSPQKNPTALESYAINYNELATQGKFSQVICRSSELAEITEILCRKNKNNPILLGQPGIGKTAGRRSC